MLSASYLGLIKENRREQLKKQPNRREERRRNVLWEDQRKKSEEDHIPITRPKRRKIIFFSVKMNLAPRIFVTKTNGRFELSVLVMGVKKESQQRIDPVRDRRYTLVVMMKVREKNNITAFIRTLCRDIHLCC